MIEIQPLEIRHAPPVSVMVGELLEEIMQVIGARAFDFDLAATKSRLADFIQEEIYVGHVAFAAETSVGFVTAYQSHSLYAGGAYGTIPELYVRPKYRSHGIGRQLLSAISDTARERNWRRLEVTTPPIPEFDRTLAFYENAGFAVTGGRKLRIEL